MAKELAVSDTSDDLDDDFFEDNSVSFDDHPAHGGRDNSIRRKIEERLERRRLMEELDMLDDIDW